jgi:molybdopterin converting factor small subunit
MSVRLHLSPLLREHSGAPAELDLAATSVRAALAELERSHARLYRSVCDETGALRRHVNLFVNSASVRELAGLDTPLRSGDKLILIQAVSGG